MLIIRADDRHARDVARREGRALWSQALPLVLEKYGYLCLEIAGQEALDTPEHWDRHGCVVVTRLPDEVWSDAVVERIVASGVPVLVEGPAPEPVRRALGAREARPTHREMTVVGTDAEMGTLAKAVSPHLGGHIRLPVSKPLMRDSRLDWEALPGVPLTAPQTAAWRAAAWDAEEWTDVDADARVLAAWFRWNTGQRFPALMMRENLCGCSIGLMTYLGQMHTSEPSSGPEWRSSSSILGLEALLLGVVDLLHRRASATRPRVRPWPHGARWVLNVRHDFDRPQSVGSVNKTLDAHRRVGTASTWYWRSRHLERRRAHGLLRTRGSRPAGTATVRAVVARPGHEVAHHTELPWCGADDEQKAIERAIDGRVLGTAAHGDPTCFRYQGAPNVLWAERQRMLYTELIQHSHMHPHRFAALKANGEIDTLQVLCLPHHVSFERSATRGDTLVEKVLAAPSRFTAAQGMLQVMNHPDLHQDELFRALAAFPTQGRLDWTAAQAADWWRRTHVVDNLRLEVIGRRLTVHAREPVEGIVLELLEPDGTWTVVEADVSPDRPASVPLNGAGVGRPGRSTAGRPRAT